MGLISFFALNKITGRNFLQIQLCKNLSRFLLETALLFSALWFSIKAYKDGAKAMTRRFGFKHIQILKRKNKKKLKFTPLRDSTGAPCCHKDMDSHENEAPGSSGCTESKHKFYDQGHQ